MELKVSLIDNQTFLPVCDLGDPHIKKFIKDVDDENQIFSVRLTIDCDTLEGESRSLHNVILDLIINHRLLLSGRDFNFFISEEPIISISPSGGESFVTFYSAVKRRKLTVRLATSDFDEALSLQSCAGLRLLEDISPSRFEGIFQHVHEDLASKNRASFVR